LHLLYNFKLLALTYFNYLINQQQMKKALLFFTLLCFITLSYAQIDSGSKYAATITTAVLQKHLAIIASDEMEGRETGTEGQQKAAAYIEAEFKNAGLLSPAPLNGYQQLFPLYKDSVTGSNVKIGGQQLVLGTDYYIPLTKNDSKKIKSSAIVFVGYGISEPLYDDYKNIDAKGKVVLMVLGEPKTDGKYLLTGTSQSSAYTYPGLSKKLQLAKDKGAVAAIILNPSMETISNYTISGNSKSAVYYPYNNSGLLNHIILSHQAAKNIFISWQIDSVLANAKKMLPLAHTSAEEIKISVGFNYTKEKKLINASNVIGIIEGTDKKDEYVFLTGHYDHLGKHDGKIYYGADDDGSGTCAVIAMAGAFAKAKAEGHGPRRTIVCMTVSGEEKGLWGSEYYSDHPVYPLEKTSVDLNTDMVGRIDTERKSGDTLNYVYVIGHNKLSSDLAPINEGVNKQSTNLVLDYKFDDPTDPNRIYFRSDHYNFARKGVPILFFYDGMLKADYHKPTDTIDKIYWALYEKRVRMIFHTAWSIANRDEMLKRDIPLPEEEK
jgi:Peptidase family M28/PA domain